MNKILKVAVLNDTSEPSLGAHGLHTAFIGLPEVEIVALVDSNVENTAECIEPVMTQTRALRHYSELEVMLKNENPDIVVLCSRNPHNHFEQIKTCTAYGAHIYCEKPLCVTLTEAKEIINIVESNNIKFCIAHPAIYDLAHLTMKKMINEGAIGTPLTAYGKGKNDCRGGGEDLIVLGTHILSLQNYFFGAPHSVFSDITSNGKSATLSDVKKSQLEPIGPILGDNICAVFSYSDGIRFIFESCKKTDDRILDSIQMGLAVTGTKGIISLRFIDFPEPEPILKINRTTSPSEDCSNWEAIPLKDNREIPGALPLDYSLCGQRFVPKSKLFLQSHRFAAWDLICSIKEDRQPEASVYTAAMVVEMIQGIYSSHLSGKKIFFPLDKIKHPLIINQ